MHNKTAGDIMTRSVITVAPDTLLTDAVRLMMEHRIGGLVVMDQGRIAGVVTEGDIMNFVLSGDAADTAVSEAMTTEVVTLEAATDVTSVVTCLVSRRIRRVPVVQDGKLVGVISRRDVLREMLNMYNRY
jgi:CBS domain-containing protein